MCQLTARLSTESSRLQASLTKLIYKSAVEHPHHVIPMLFALKNAASHHSTNSVPEETKVGVNSLLMITQLFVAIVFAVSAFYMTSIE